MRGDERDLSRFFSLSNDLLAVIGFDGLLRQPNPAWRSTLGWSLPELEQQRWCDLLHPGDAGPAADALAEAIAGGRPVSIEARCRCRDGSHRLIHWHGQAFAEEGELYLVGQDVHHAHSDEQAAPTEPADNRSTQLTRPFIQAVADRLKLSTAGVLRSIYALQEPDLPEPQRQRHTRLLRDTGRNLLHLLSNLRDLARQPVTIDPQPSDLLHLLHRLDAHLRPMAIEKGIELKLDLNQPVPRQMVTDPHRLEQALLTLGRNAVRFTRDGQAAISWRIDTDGQTNRLIFEVTDTGIGIEADKLDALFSLCQDPEQMRQRQRGLHMGLILARQIARALGGDLTATSELGVGSRFTLEIAPQSIDAHTTDNPAQHAHARPDDPARPLKNVRVLVAEDNPQVQQLVDLVLRGAGAEFVQLADDGGQAVAMLQNAMMENQPFDLVLLDIHMPFVDGPRAVKDMRHAGFGGSIVALTADHDDRARRRFLGMGFDELVTKPLEFDELVRTVREHKAQPLPPQEPGDDGIGERADGPLMSTLGEDPDFGELVEMFVSELPERVAAMRSAADHSDLNQLAGLAHQLKGAADGYGFHPITEAAHRLEARARGAGDQTLEQLSDTLGDLIDLCERARAAKPDEDEA